MFQVGERRSSKKVAPKVIALSSLLSSFNFFPLVLASFVHVLHSLSLSPILLRKFFRGVSPLEFEEKSFHELPCLRGVSPLAREFVSFFLSSIVPSLHVLCFWWFVLDFSGSKTIGVEGCFGTSSPSTVGIPSSKANARG
ncbi:unnamed protein product [Victoria cruziana]